MGYLSTWPGTVGHLTKEASESRSTRVGGPPSTVPNTARISRPNSAIAAPAVLLDSCSATLSEPYLTRRSNGVERGSSLPNPGPTEIQKAARNDRRSHPNGIWLYPQVPSVHATKRAAVSTPVEGRRIRYNLPVHWDPCPDRSTVPPACATMGFIRGVARIRAGPRSRSRGNWPDQQTALWHKRSTRPSPGSWMWSTRRSARTGEAIASIRQAA